MITDWDALRESALRTTTENVLVGGTYAALTSSEHGKLQFAFAFEVLDTSFVDGELMVMHRRHRIVATPHGPAMLLDQGDIIDCPAALLGLSLGREYDYVCTPYTDVNRIRAKIDEGLYSLI